MASLSTILKQLISEDENLNITELARKTDIVQPVMHRLVTGQTDNPKIQTLVPIAEYFGISIDELLGRSPLSTLSSSNKRILRSSVPIVEWHKIENWLAEPSIETSNIAEISTSLSSHAYALVVKDSTMSPKFSPGDILFIEPEIKPENGDFVIVSADSQFIFKQVFFDGGDIYLKPLNPDFKTLYFDKKSPVKFLGVVVEAQMKFKELSARKHS